MLKFITCSLTLVLSLTVIFSCQKKDSLQESKYQEGWIRIIGVRGTDTSSTKFVNGRVETVGLLLVEDDKLRAELMSYQPLAGGMAKYIVKITNKTDCQRILRWNWQNINPTSIDPNDLTAGTGQADILGANQVKTYIIIGYSVAGRIYVQAQKSNSDCPNSSQLILEITNTILPITFTNIKVDKKDKDYVVIFSTDSPQDVDTFYAMWTPDGSKIKETIRATIVSDPNTKNYKVSFPRIKIEDK